MHGDSVIEWEPAGDRHVAVPAAPDGVGILCQGVATVLDVLPAAAQLQVRLNVEVSHYCISMRASSDPVPPRPCQSPRLLAESCGSAADRVPPRKCVLFEMLDCSATVQHH